MPTAAEPEPPGGDVDIAAIGALLGDPARSRILMALDDGRALPATLLAAEAGVTPATASSHLRKLVDGGLLTVEAHGRHRYFRLAGPQVGQLLEAMTRLAPARPVRSLRQGTRAHALRRARTCYDHLAGRLGVDIMGTFIDRGYLTGGDGASPPRTPTATTATATATTWTTCSARPATTSSPASASRWPRHPTVRYCIDWSEQRHHLAGTIGRGLLRRLRELDWTRVTPTDRAVQVSAAGREGLRRALEVDLR